MDDPGSSSNSAQIVEMENIYEKIEEEHLAQDWFWHERECDQPLPHQTLKDENIWISWETLTNDDQNLDMSERIKGLHELAFEAKSSKESAWYDVALFLTHRVNHRGELEARVRFSGFGKEEDEWVNVRNGVRERSVPLEPSECRNVEVGDLVLCYQEREDQAVYVDAHVEGIQRRPHDLSECKCIFIVHYDFDNSEEEVNLRSMCRPHSHRSTQQKGKEIIIYDRALNHPT